MTNNQQNMQQNQRYKFSLIIFLLKLGVYTYEQQFGQSFGSFVRVAAIFNQRWRAGCRALEKSLGLTPSLNIF